MEKTSSPSLSKQTPELCPLAIVQSTESLFFSISIVGLSDFNRFLNPLFCFGFGLFKVNVGLGAQSS